MRRQVRAALGTVVSVALAASPSLAPAAARTTGKESFKGTLVKTAPSGTSAIVSTVIGTSGVFKGLGRIAERESRPGDPQNVNRDDLVFPHGTIHIAETNKPPKISLDPQTCVLTIRLRQTVHVQGGTRRFRHASGTLAGAVRGWAVTARNPDGTCSQDAEPLLEVDEVAARGTLSF
jgi:hypothetical protein